MDGSHGFVPSNRKWDRITPGPDYGGGPALPEREWGLSAGQVVAVVLTILAVCEVIGLLN